MKRRIRTWVKAALFLLILGGALLWIRSCERRTLYSPSLLVKVTPASIKLPFDNIVIATADGVNIHGWFVPAASGAESGPSGDTLLFFHSGAGNISDRLDKLRLFHDIGLNVFLLDYRGYGKSAGEPSERGLALDALAAYFYLVGKRGVPPERLFLYGESLGAAVAIELATKVRAAGLITEAAFVSLPERFRQDWPLIPWNLLLRDKYDSLSKINDVRMPLLFLHRLDDERIPFTDSQRLYGSARHPNQLVELHGKRADAFVNSFDTCYHTIAGFVRQRRAGATP